VCDSAVGVPGSTSLLDAITVLRGRPKARLRHGARNRTFILGFVTSIDARNFVSREASACIAL